MTLTPLQTLPQSAQPCIATRARWNPRSITLIVLAWLILQIGGLFTPGLLDDVDSIYLEIARQMLVRHDYMTPYIDGIRFFDKPPLMYWLAAGSMHIFGAHAWAGRLPLALLMLALLLATYALGLRLFASISPPPFLRQTAPDRAALYSALALATCIGPYLYTRFYIPDMVVALWMTLAVHLFLLALERTCAHRPSLLPCLGFAAVTALNLLTKGFIGLVFPIGFVVLYLAFTRQLRLLRKFHLISSTVVFLAIALPWHILAALRNPAIAMPPGFGLPARAGWAWFYLYNEHIARFLSRRIPHDYGQVPVAVFWLLTAIWIFPWIAFLPGAISQHMRDLRSRVALPRQREAAITLLLWAGLVMGFFTISARQEYYALPAMPALALMAGGLLARIDHKTRDAAHTSAHLSALRWHRWLLLPLCSLLAAVALFFAIAAPHTDPQTDIATLLVQGGGSYNLSLSHMFDLTGRAMGLFRGPLLGFGLSMIAIGPLSYLLRRGGRTYAANLALAAAATCLLLTMHEGLVRFYPTLGSEGLANAILAEQARNPRPGDLVLIDGELTSGSTLIFYTHEQAHLVNGHLNGPWFGSFWPDAPPIFETDASLDRLWAGSRRFFLLTYHPDARIADLTRFGPVRVLATAGGKSILTNQP